MEYTLVSKDLFLPSDWRKSGHQSNTLLKKPKTKTQKPPKTPPKPSTTTSLFEGRKGVIQTGTALLACQYAGLSRTNFIGKAN